MFCSSLYTRFSLESVFAWCGPHRDWSHGEGPDSGPLVSVQGLRGQSGGQGTVQHRNQQVGGHGCQQLLILMLSAHHCKIHFFYTQAWSTTGLLCPITLWSAAAYHCVFCHWSSTHSSQYVLLRLKSQHRRFSFSGREWQASALTSRSNQTSSSSLSQACSCGRQTPLSQQLLSGLSAPDVAKHAISVPGEKKVVSSLTRNSNVSL